MLEKIQHEAGNLKDHTIHQSKVEREQILDGSSTVEELIDFLNMSPQQRKEKNIRVAFWVQLSAGIYHLASQFEPPYWELLSHP